MSQSEDPGFRKREVKLPDGRSLVYYDLVPASESKPAAPTLTPAPQPRKS